MNEKANASAAPVRRRRIATQGAETNHVKVIESLATEFYVNSKQANAAAGKASRARKSLLAAMQAAELKHADITATIEGKALALSVDVAAPVRMVVDVAKLAKLISLEDLLSVVSASQAAVKDKFGSHLLPSICTESEGETNVSVSVPKVG